MNYSWNTKILKPFNYVFEFTKLFSEEVYLHKITFRIVKSAALKLSSGNLRQW